MIRASVVKLLAMGQEFIVMSESDALLALFELSAVLENWWTNSPSQIKTRGYDPALDLLLILPILHLTWDNPN